MTSPLLSSNATHWWHGAQRWDGMPTVQPSRKGCYECGPGMYLTNRRQTALKYSKGPGSLVHMEVAPNLTLLQDVTFTRAQMQEALDCLPRLRHRARIEEDLDRCAARHPDGNLCGIYLVNLCVNHEALIGASGPRLAQWLSDHGVDASLESKSSNEEWLVVFNPKVITRSQKLSGQQADQMPYDFETLSAQREKSHPITAAPVTRTWKR